MKNREWMLNLSQYDMLCRMNAYIRTTVEHYAMAITQPCIMTALGMKERNGRCNAYRSDCGKCISDWLNEECKK